jgi:uracil-DNA glycosylase family 4
LSQKKRLTGRTAIVIDKAFLYQTLTPTCWQKKMRKQDFDQLNDQIVACQQCVRLREHCREIGQQKRKSFLDWDYWSKPVPNFGVPNARLLIIGLAPAAHGANRTGRMFTGDRSGDWLFRALHKAGFANQPTATSSDDQMKLKNCAITAICHCAPPDNKPTSQEIDNCLPWLNQLLDLGQHRVFLALGQIGWQGIWKILRARKYCQGAIPPFSHGAKIELAKDCWLLGSYHPSQQNTFTGRLTEEMLDEVFAMVNNLLGNGR